MNLHLLRHAKTQQESETGKDFDRKLMPKGHFQTEHIANHLCEVLDFSKIEIHCSTSARTKQTLEIMAPKIPMSNIHFSDSLYLCTHLDLVKYINSIHSHKDLFLIGHNNGLSDLISYLSNQFIDLKTCEYYGMEFQINSWEELSQGQAKIISSFHPQVD